MDKSFSINKICIVGAGNVGVATAVDIYNATHKEVILHTSKADRLKEYFIKIDTDTNEIKKAKIKVTNDYSISMCNTDLVIITVPTFVIEPILDAISNFNPKIILFIPGFGGKEFFCKNLISKDCVIAGVARSPYICRLKDAQVVFASKKKKLQVATLKKCAQIDTILFKLFEIPIEKYPNYLLITFTPSNPILHTARLYSMFKNSNFNSRFSHMIKFYGEWTNFSSEILIKMDDELNKIIHMFKNIDLSNYVNLKDYYESYNVEEMTKKITSIKSWQNIDSPMIKEKNFFYIDKYSRYFQEDFLYGLCNLKGYAEIVGVTTRTMDEVLNWYQKISGIELFNELGEYCGSGLQKSGIPQRFGIKTIGMIENFYLQ